MRLNIKLGDIAVVIIIVIAAFLITISFHEDDSSEKTAVITQNNIVLDRVRLDKLSERYTLNYFGQYPGTIEAENGRIRFLHAECPDKVCVKTGWISHPGQIAVCLPANVIIKIEGETSDLDIIVR